MILIIIIAILITIIVIYKYLTWNFGYWRDRNVPHLKPHIFFGNFKEMLSNSKHFGEFYKDLYRKFDKTAYIGYYGMSKPGILLKDPKLIKSVLVDDFGHFDRNDSEVDSRNDPILRSNIFTQYGEEWKRNRSAWTQALSAPKLKSMFENMNNKCDVMLNYIKGHTYNKPGESLEAKDIASNFLTDVIISSLFDFEINSFQNPNITFKSIAGALHPSTLLDSIAMICLTVAPWLGKMLNFSYVSRKARVELMKISKHVLRQREMSGYQRDNPLDVILQKERNKSKYREHEISGLLFSFLLDGIETTSGTAGFVMYSLASNPQIQNKLRMEIEKHRHENNGIITFENINNLTYLDMVILETLRLYPPGLAILRMCTKEHVFPSAHPNGKPVRIHAGTSITIPVYALHRDVKHHHDPDHFNPERFSPENKREIKPFTFLPFGEGPRLCLGMRLAMTQIKIAIVGIISNFELRLAPKMQGKEITIDPKSAFFKSIDDLWITFHNIEKIPF